MPAKTVLDALDAALGTSNTDEEEVTPPESEDTDTGEDGNEAPEGEEVESDEETTDETDGEEPGEGETDGEEPGEGETDGEGGEPETPEAKAEREAAEKAEKDAARKPIDLLNDPIPESAPERTKKRITGLVDRVRELEPRAAQGDEIIALVTGTGMSADEFSMALTFGRLKNSDSVEDQRKAYQILVEGIKELAPMVGEVLPWADPTDGHPDLQQRVKEGKLDPKDAAEIAKGRNRVKAETLASQRANQSRQTAEQRARQTQELEHQSREALNDIGASLEAADPYFDKKMEILQRAPKGADGMTPMQRIATAPPQLRVNAFLKAFKAIKYTPPKTVTRVGAGQQPLRANRQPAAGGNIKQAPKSAVEAMDLALGLK